MTDKNQNIPAQSISKSEYDKAWYQQNKQKKLDQSKIYYEQNKEHLLNQQKERYTQDSKTILRRNKKWREENLEYYKEISKDYYLVNKAKILNNALIRHYRRLKTDMLYKAKCALRTLVNRSFKRISKNKPTNTNKLLGCTWEEAKVHFESLFQEGMTWENHGEWHIDHVRPIASFAQDELHLMNHISNLQPLWAKDNLQKSDTY